MRGVKLPHGLKPEGLGDLPRRSPIGRRREQASRRRDAETGRGQYRGFIPFRRLKRDGRKPFGLRPSLILAAIYSRGTYRPTTIDVLMFHFRVRNGTGWGHQAMTTRLRGTFCFGALFFVCLLIMLPLLCWWGKCRLTSAWRDFVLNSVSGILHYQSLSPGVTLLKCMRSIGC